MHTVPEIRSRRIDAGDVQLHVLEAGEGPLVLLLHGYPEFSYGWRRQIQALAAEGFRVVVPDQRGFGRSDKPRGAKRYRVERLAADVVALIDAYDEPAAAIAGHDWGGAVAWYTAMLHPERVRRLAILGCPHPAALHAALRTPGQMRRSWYVFFFQLPLLPELYTLLYRLRPMMRTVFTDAAPGAIGDADLDHYVEAWKQAGLSNMRWYRAWLRRRPGALARQWRVIDHPTLYLWGGRERYFEPDLAQPPADWVTAATVKELPQASHWIQHDEPVAVNELLAGFFAANGSSRR